MIYRQLKNKNTPIIMGGDFNHILNPEIDRQFQVRHNYSETRTTEESLLRNTQLKLIDAYRCFEPQAINFTNHNQLNNRRIDRFHLSERLSKNNSFLRMTLLDQLMNESPSFLNLPTNQSLTWEKTLHDQRLPPNIYLKCIKFQPSRLDTFATNNKTTHQKKRFPKVPRSTTLTADTFDDLRIRYNGKSKPKSTSSKQ